MAGWACKCQAGDGGCKGIHSPVAAAEVNRKKEMIISPPPTRTDIKNTTINILPSFFFVVVIHSSIYQNIKKNDS